MDHAIEGENIFDDMRHLFLIAKYKLKLFLSLYRMAHSSLIIPLISIYI